MLLAGNSYPLPLLKSDYARHEQSWDLDNRSAIGVTGKSLSFYLTKSPILRLTIRCAAIFKILYDLVAAIHLTCPKIVTLVSCGKDRSIMVLPWSLSIVNGVIPKASILVVGQRRRVALGFEEVRHRT